MCTSIRICHVHTRARTRTHAHAHTHLHLHISIRLSGYIYMRTDVNGEFYQNGAYIVKSRSMETKPSSAEILSTTTSYISIFGLYLRESSR